MLEVFLIIFLSKKIGLMLEQKGRKKVPYIILFVLLWIVGEFAGAIVGTISQGAGRPIVYLYALIGAGVGTAISFLFANALSDVSGLKELEQKVDSI